MLVNLSFNRYNALLPSVGEHSIFFESAMGLYTVSQRNRWHCPVFLPWDRLISGSFHMITKHQ